MKRHLTIKVCALGAALAAGVVTGQAGQVQATPRAITAGPVEVTGKPVSVSKEAVRWEPGTYRVRYLTVEATGYAPLDCSSDGCCYSGNPKITASGARTKPGVTVAAPKHMPFGIKLFIPNYGGTRVVEDRGGAIKGNKLDLCFQTRRAALEFGRRRVRVMVFEMI